jgi:RHS repeat-associated protein
VATTNYYSLNSEIIGEKTVGGTRTDYLTDALGSVTATMNQSAQVVNTYRFKPYGAQLAKTGVGADPAFRWVGQGGYRQTGKKFSDVYIRARHYDIQSGTWTTIDPLLLHNSRSTFSYVNARVPNMVDPSGLLSAWYEQSKPKNPCDMTDLHSDRDCVANSQDYCDECVKHPNGLDCCAAGVSRGICIAIIACDNFTCYFPDLRYICDALQCQNTCMFNHWLFHDTPLWKRAEEICKKAGTQSFEFCFAKVQAEQDGYTRCAPQCGVAAALRAWPWPNRVDFAINQLKCCGFPKPGQTIHIDVR